MSALGVRRGKAAFSSGCKAHPATAPEGLVFSIHAYAGFVILMLLFFRAGWGIIGSRHSRFADFIYSWSTTWRYALSFLRFKPQRYVGHNPLGGWMVILMLVVLTATALSGILMVTKGAGCVCRRRA